MMETDALKHLRDISGVIEELFNLIENTDNSTVCRVLTEQLKILAAAQQGLRTHHAPEAHKLFRDAIADGRLGAQARVGFSRVRNGEKT